MLLDCIKLHQITWNQRKINYINNPYIFRHNRSFWGVGRGCLGKVYDLVLTFGQVVIATTNFVRQLKYTFSFILQCILAMVCNYCKCQKVTWMPNKPPFHTFYAIWCMIRKHEMKLHWYHRKRRQWYGIILSKSLMFCISRKNLVNLFTNISCTCLHLLRYSCVCFVQKLHA